MNNVKKKKNVRVLGQPIVVGDTAIIQKSDTLGSYIVEKNGVKVNGKTLSVAEAEEETNPTVKVILQELRELCSKEHKLYSMWLEAKNASDEDKQAKIAAEIQVVQGEKHVRISKLESLGETVPWEYALDVNLFVTATIPPYEQLQPQAEPTKKKSNGVLYGIIAAVVAIILINN